MLKKICIGSAMITGGLWIIYTLGKEKKRFEMKMAVMKEISLMKNMPIDQITDDMLDERLPRRSTKPGRDGAELLARDLVRTTRRNVRAETNFVCIETYREFIDKCHFA